MTQKQFTHWIENLYATQDDELDCKQLQKYLPALVEAELSESPLPHTAVLKAHLRHCPDCDESHRGLLLVVSSQELTPPSSATAEFSPQPTGD